MTTTRWAAISSPCGMRSRCAASPGIIGETTEVSTLFLAAARPSVLTADELQRLCTLVRSSFHVPAWTEWTVECNPESFSEEKASVLLDNGVTRLSVGFQSLHDRELRVLGRVHSADRCRQLLGHPLLSRFASVGVDLMYGLPGQNAGSLEETVSAIVDSAVVRHVSAYELTIADRTPFGRHRRLLPLPDEQTMVALTERLRAMLAAAGFERYEVSNFAHPGHQCRHNEAYWDHRPYLGLGCAAHSYIGGARFANVSDFDRYCAGVGAGALPREFTEIIDARKLATEMVFLGLRRSKGFDESVFREKCGFPIDTFINKEKIAEFVDQGLLTYTAPIVKPTARGLLVVDAIAAALISDLPALETSAQTSIFSDTNV